MAVDSGRLTILFLFDLSSAFAIIPHTTLLNRISPIGISHLTACVFPGCIHSPIVLWCAPGTLFTTYLLPLGNSFTNSVFQLTVPQMTLSPNSPTRRLPNSQDTNCFNEVRSCFPSNFFIFNSDKTELIFMSFPPANQSPLPLTFRVWVSSSVAHWLFTGT